MRSNNTSSTSFPLFTATLSKGRCGIYEGYDTSKMNGDLDLIRDIANGPGFSLFNIQNVYDLGAKDNHLQENIGNSFTTMPCFPPFPYMWMEWDVDGTPFACLSLTTEHETEFMFLGSYPDQNPIVSMISGVVVSMTWSEEGSLANDGFGISYPYSPKDTASRLYSPNAHGKHVLDQLLTKSAKSSTYIALASFLFAHCKNVDIVERLPKRHEQRAAKRAGEPILKYHEIVIDPNRSYATNATSKDPSTKPSKALHIARGHFAHYTDEKPLFGKYAGTFWVPAHVRGKADNGVINSTYRVKAAA
jgi:hypothetical protein